MARSSKLKPVLLSAFILFTTELLVACIPLAIGTATVTAVDVALDRRTLGRNIDDNKLELKLRKDYQFDDELGRAVHLSVTAVNGVVLLTGEVQRDQQRQRAETIARGYPETRQVVNEIALSGTTNINSRVNDSWITGKVKAKLLKAKGVPASNIKVVTEKGSVYMMGLITQLEADRAVEIAQSVRGVTHIYKVFEYVKS